MKANDIRSLAKAIRNGKCDMTVDEMQEFLLEAFQYVEENNFRWKVEFQDSVEDALGVIQAAVEKVEAVEAEMAGAAESGELVEVVEEAATADEAPAKRCNFKTVMKRLAEEGAADPVLETIRWFATVYARDEYGKVKTIRGMITRRGYDTEGSDDEFTVSKEGRLLARVKSESGKVAEFEMAAA